MEIYITYSELPTIPKNVPLLSKISENVTFLRIKEAFLKEFLLLPLNISESFLQSLN